MPSGNFSVQIQNGVVTLNTSESVLTVLDSGAGTLIVDGATLTATSQSGVTIFGTLSVTGGAISAPVIFGGNLIAHGSMLTGTVGVSAINANINNSGLNSLSMTGQLTMADSTVHSLSQNPSSLAIFAPSSITNSTIESSIQIAQGGSLVIDQGSQISTPAC